MNDPATLERLLMEAREAWFQGEVRDIRRVVRDLNAPGILSTRAIAAIVRRTPETVKKYFYPGQRSSGRRGTLNPRHLSILLMGLEHGRLKPHLVKLMIEDGTDLTAISALTNIEPEVLRWQLEHA